MTETIHGLLLRNLQEVFGEGDPAKRRSAIKELYTDDCVLYVPPGIFVGHDALGRAAQFQVDDKTWATALAVAFFRKHLSKQPDLLEGLLDKAMEYVRDNANFESLVAHAKALII